ncbi:ATP-binding protein, partial [Arthrobacter sp. H5]|uniref:AAA family ATPase n=1 Tax=Arthrobacter sp. H5 TaxID=1267973 RepID=UPI0006888E9E
MSAAPILFLLVGLPGAGKTTRAVELEAQHHALRLTPDEWMIPLFGESDADGKRDVLEGRLIWVAARALSSGASVILDFGLWGKDERSALRAMASTLGVECRVEYLEVDHATQWERITGRYATTPDKTFELTEDMIAGYRNGFQAPTAGELAGGSIG